jgi:hypothetical protein
MTNELLLPERHVASKGQNHFDHVLNFKLINYIDKNVNTHLVTSHISKLTDLYMYSISTSDVIRKENNEIMNNTIVRHHILLYVIYSITITFILIITIDLCRKHQCMCIRQKNQPTEEVPEIILRGHMEPTAPSITVNPERRSSVYSIQTIHYPRI